MTDKFQNAAKFIIFTDVGDILLPRMGTTYMEEFMKLATLYPLAAAYSYNRFAASFSRSTLYAGGGVDGKYNNTGKRA